jgi:hypothetical protein
MLEEDSGIIGGEYDGCDIPKNYVILGDIDRIVFQEIQKIVSHASPDERFSQGFAEHKLVLDNQEKPLSEVIKDFDFQKFYNLIRRIQQELNSNRSNFGIQLIDSSQFNSRLNCPYSNYSG